MSTEHSYHTWLAGLKIGDSVAVAFASTNKRDGRVQRLVAKDEKTGEFRTDVGSVMKSNGEFIGNVFIAVPVVQDFRTILIDIAGKLDEHLDYEPLADASECVRNEISKYAEQLRAIAKLKEVFVSDTDSPPLDENKDHSND